MLFTIDVQLTSSSDSTCLVDVLLVSAVIESAVSVLGLLGLRFNGGSSRFFRLNDLAIDERVFVTYIIFFINFSKGLCRKYAFIQILIKL